MKVEESQNLSVNMQSYLKMVLIREAELKIGSEFRKKTFQTPIHLAVGQEAISVGVSNYLLKTDAVFGNHRSHGHYLALGGSLKDLFSEILGRSSGCSGGKGGSMHIKSPENGLIGTMPIVASTIPIAVGAALALKSKDSSSVSVAFFGDGATEEGVFHESLNLASILGLPILFVCENNQFSSHLHISERQRSNETARFAKANNIIHKVVDGNSLDAVQAATAELLGIARASREPVYLEAKTYRLYGHVGGEVDETIGLNRELDLKAWSLRDPLKLLRKELLSTGEISEGAIEKLEISIRKQVDETWHEALSESYPIADSLLDGVYYE
jgi:TPP-dependent pyruvate/acetoin dehydrogenase alpha subunit